MNFDIQLPDNKSIKIRQLIVEFVKNGTIGQLTENDCNDVIVVHNGLLKLKSAINSDSITIINIEDCGLAYRCFVALSAVLNCSILITGTEHLLKRPIEPLVESLISIGAIIRKTERGWLIQGKKLSANEISIDATSTSQFATAIALISPLIGLRKLNLIGKKPPSIGYLKMTLLCMQYYKLDIPHFNFEYSQIGAIGDWSAAVFWLAHCCLHSNNQYILHPLSKNSIQSDSIVADWFGDLGIDISYSNENITITKIQNIEFPIREYDMRNNIDLVPVMAALATALPARFCFFNVENLKYKESDRLQALISQLSPFANISYNDGTLIVEGYPNTTFENANFNTFDDHRMAMAFLLLAPKDNLSNTKCLSKSYPNLLKQISSVR